jgi:hypothetical protein
LTSLVKIPPTAHVWPFVSIIMAVTVASHASKVLAVELRYGELSAWPYSDGVKIFLTIIVGTKRQTTVLLAV